MEVSQVAPFAYSACFCLGFKESTIWTEKSHIPIWKHNNKLCVCVG